MSDNDYANRQADKDRNYLNSFTSPESRQWAEGLTPEQRRMAEEQGLLKPMLDRAGSTMRDENASDSSSSRCCGAAVGGSDTLEAVLADYPHLEAAIEERARKMNAGGKSCDVLASFCARMRGCANPALVFDAVCYGTGVLAIEGQSATELAKKHGVTKQAFSKIAVEWCEKFGLPPARSMKSKPARKAYRERARAIHERWKLT